MSLLDHKKALAVCGGIILIGGIFAVTAHSKSTKTATAQHLNLYETATIASLDTAKIRIAFRATHSVRSAKACTG